MTQVQNTLYIIDGDVIKFEHDDRIYAVHIMRDEFARNPRKEFDNLGKMICWHKRYRLGDEHNYTYPSELIHDLNRQEHIILPLYLMDHGSISISTKDFYDPWDSGQVGWIYMTKNAYLEAGLPKEQWPTKAVEILKSEVETYDLYLSGECYGYTLCEDTSGIEPPEWDEIDSCWGFYGDDIVASGMADSIPGLLEAIEGNNYVQGEAVPRTVIDYVF